MATYKITDPTTGRTLKITGDSPPSEAELGEIFSSVPHTPTPPVTPSVQEASMMPNPLKDFQETPGDTFLEKGYNALALPEKQTREVLMKGAQALTPKTEVTGNRLRDIARNTPKILTESAAEVLPSLISRGQLLTAGGLKLAGAAAPLLNPIRKGIFKTLEGTSGIAPRAAGALEEAFQNPKLIFSKGKEAAGKFYEAAKEAIGGEEALAKLARPERAPKVIATAVDKLKSGMLKPLEALKARKAVDAVMSSKTYLKDDLVPLRKAFDSVAKLSENISKGDKAYEMGRKAEALRNFLPTNVGGSFSSFRTGIGGAAAAMIPGGKILAPLALSPAIQGGIATAAGAGAKAVAPLVNNPITTTLATKAIQLTVKKAKEFLKKAKGDREKAREMAKSEGYAIPEVSQ